MRVVFWLFCVLLASSTPVAAADLTGQWALDLEPDFSGHNDTLRCSFVQDGEKLTNNCGAGPNIGGEVQGQKVTFRVPTGRSGEFTAVFVGTLDTREITISGTWELMDRNSKRQGKFTATKATNTK
jgi:hypothetical protein